MWCVSRISSRLLLRTSRPTAESWATSKRASKAVAPAKAIWSKCVNELKQPSPVRAQFLQQLDEARASYRRTVGIEPYNLRIPGRLRGLPASKDASLAITLRHNPDYSGWRGR